MLIPKCSYKLNLRLHVLDPRLFQSACFPRCGCAFDDANITSGNITTVVEGVAPVQDRMCDPALWGSWLLRHFSCSGTTVQKSLFMERLYDGVLQHEPVEITKTWLEDNEEEEGRLEGMQSGGEEEGREEVAVTPPGGDP